MSDDVRERPTPDADGAVRWKWLSGLGVMVLLLGSVAGLAISRSGQADGPRGGFDQVIVRPPVDESVEAATLWAEAKNSLDCVKGFGLTVVGPFPAADGYNIAFSIEAGTSDENPPPHSSCFDRYEPLALRFALDNAADFPDEGSDGYRSEYPDMPVSSSPESITLLRIRAGLTNCLGLDDSTRDTELHRIAHDSPSKFARCVDG